MNEKDTIEYSFEKKLQLVMSGSESIEILLVDQEFKARVMRICRHYGRSFRGLSIDAEDLFQNVCLKMLERGEKVQSFFQKAPDKESFFMLVSTFARSLCTNEFKRERNLFQDSKTNEELLLLDLGLGPDLDYVVVEFEEYLSGLSEDERQIVERFREGLSLRAIANVSGCSRATVRKRIAKAISPFFDLDVVRVRKNLSRRSHVAARKRKDREDVELQYPALQSRCVFLGIGHLFYAYLFDKMTECDALKFEAHLDDCSYCLDKLSVMSIGRYSNLKAGLNSLRENPEILIKEMERRAETASKGEVTAEEKPAASLRKNKTLKASGGSH